MHGPYKRIKKKESVERFAEEAHMLDYLDKNLYT